MSHPRALFFLIAFSFISVVAVAQFDIVTDVKNSDWLGFERETFNFNGHYAFITKPEKALEGNPWIWNAYFPEWHIEMDSILLSRGFHVAHLRYNDMFGAPRAMGEWDKFYSWLVRERGFAESVALEGVSRGGLYVYGWAKRNPSKVSCIFCEGPVCDFKSWPGGNGSSIGDPREWEKLLKAYNFSNEEALAHKDNPIDNLKTLAAFKVPVIHATGLHDSIVPNEENTFVLADRYIRLGGVATIVPMTRGPQTLKGHHYPIETPERMADFIMYNSYPVKRSLSAADYHEIRSGLSNSYLKFTKTKTGRVAFLGGSITFMEGWRSSVCRYLTEKFPDTKFEFINAGISSTGSTPGSFRLSTDVLSKGEIDLLFEEAAVNDRTNGFSETASARGMEGIVNHARRANPYMDVVVMYFVDPDKMKDYNSGIVPYEIKAHDSVAMHYKIPSINLAKEITDRINNGEFTWEYDFIQLHPSPFGCEYYYQSIRRLLDDSWSRVDTSTPRKPFKNPGLLDKYSYVNGRYADIHEAKPDKGWTIYDEWNPVDKLPTREGYVNVPMLVSETPGSGLSYSFKGSAIGICVTSGPDAGIIEYSIDGKEYKKVDQYTQWSRRLHLPWYIILDDELKNIKHTLKLRIAEEKNEQSTGNACRIVYFLVN